MNSNEETISKLIEEIREKDSQIKLLRNDLKKSEDLRLKYALTFYTMDNYSLLAKIKEYFFKITSRINVKNLLIFLFLFLILWYVVLFSFTSVLNKS